MEEQANSIIYDFWLMAWPAPCTLQSMRHLLKSRLHRGKHEKPSKAASIPIEEEMMVRNMKTRRHPAEYPSRMAGYPDGLRDRPPKNSPHYGFAVVLSSTSITPPLSSGDCDMTDMAAFTSSTSGTSTSGIGGGVIGGIGETFSSSISLHPSLSDPFPKNRVTCRGSFYAKRSCSVIVVSY